MHKYKRVEIEWSDASHYSDPRSHKEIRQECALQSVATIGYLVQKGRRFVKVSGEILEDGRLRDTSVIPRPEIKQIIYLEQAK